MNLSDVIAADVTAVFLDTAQGFAQSITRYPLGDGANPQPVDAIVDEHAPREENRRGREIVRTATLHLAAAQTVDARDKWLIGSVEWQARTWACEDDGPTDPNMTQVLLQRNELERRTNTGGMLL